MSSAQRMEEYDLVIIGGGISGLYAAWRLGKATDMNILVLESTDRFGGRFHTVTMPGGYSADLGAMRFVPTLHKVLQKLIEEMGLETTEMAATAEPENALKMMYYRGQRASNAKELSELLGIGEEDMSLLLQLYTTLEPGFVGSEVEVPENGNYAEAIVRRTGQKAKDLSVSQYLALSDNPELVRFSDLRYPPGNWSLSDCLAKMSAICKIFEPGFIYRIIGGYESLVTALTEKIGSLSNVTMTLGREVIRVNESEPNDFEVMVLQEDRMSSFKCNKIMFACATFGLSKIQFVSEKMRHQRLQELMAKTQMHSSVKVFFTYKTPWWEQYGFYFGCLASDLPTRETMALGNAAKVGGYATFMPAYTFRDIEVFESLDRPHYKRFENQCEDVQFDADLIPSERLVEYCEKKMCQLLGCDEPPERPVCAVRKFWGRGKTQGISQPCKPGVDSNKLHWESLKPFPDADIYIASDSFTASDETTCYVGFSETSLLTTERILVNYFSLDPVREGLSLTDPWP